LTQEFGFLTVVGMFDAEDAISIIEVVELPPAPRKGLVVVTCMDSRLDVFQMLGLEIGDAHILRNAGGRVTDDTLRSLVLSMHMMNTREVFVIHHTGCGLHRVTNEMLQGRVSEVTGEDASHVDFLPFDDVIASVREDARRVRDLPLLPDGVTVTGAVYDVHTGTLYRVKAL
jgi:carbonic anhydrase